jgi:hypothetical protein
MHGKWMVMKIQHINFLKIKHPNVKIIFFVPITILCCHRCCFFFLLQGLLVYSFIHNRYICSESFRLLTQITSNTLIFFVFGRLHTSIFFWSLVIYIQMTRISFSFCACN